VRSADFLIGENVAQRAVVRHKHPLREPNPMPVSHANLSLNQAHCLRENAPPADELPVFLICLAKAWLLSKGFHRAWPTGTTVLQ
jgi:hypothetical protein